MVALQDVVQVEEEQGAIEAPCSPWVSVGVETPPVSTNGYAPRVFIRLECTGAGRIPLYRQYCVARYSDGIWYREDSEFCLAEIEETVTPNWSLLVTHWMPIPEV